jgi:lipoprotein NlpI
MHRNLLVFVVCFASFQAIGWASEEETVDLLRRAERAAQDGKSAEAVRWATAAIDAGVIDPVVYYLRGREHFRLGKVRQSVDDFDRFLAQRPDRSTSLWERGISCYYAGQYAAGAKQFADYQTYHSNDVENAVWHLLCNSKVKGFETARQQLLPIQSDRRVPMMTIYDLFRGEAQPDDVLKAVKDRPSTKEQMNHRLFYAHLYLGLYYEACGEAAKAREHILTAAEKHRIQGYMWDVAHVHAQRFQPDRPTKSGS